MIIGKSVLPLEFSDDVVGERLRVEEAAAEERVEAVGAHAVEAARAAALEQRELAARRAAPEHEHALHAAREWRQRRRLRRRLSRRLPSRARLRLALSWLCRSL